MCMMLIVSPLLVGPFAQPSQQISNLFHNDLPGKIKE